MRVNVNLSDELVSRVDKIAKDYGVPRASLLSVFIGQSVATYEKGLDFAKMLVENERLQDKIVEAASK